MPDLHHGIANGSIAVRVILHGVSNNVGHLVVATILHFPHGVKDSALNGFQPIISMRYGTFENDIGSVVEKPIAIHVINVNTIIGPTVPIGTVAVEQGFRIKLSTVLNSQFDRFFFGCLVTVFSGGSWSFSGVTLDCLLNRRILRLRIFLLFAFLVLIRHELKYC